MLETEEFAQVMHDFFTTVLVTRQDLRKRVQKHLEVFGYEGLTLEMTQVIFCLGAFDGKANQQDIADRLNKNKSSITSLIDNLIKRDMITRKINPNDRRHNIIALTDKGYAFIDEFYPTVYKTYEIDKIPMNLDDMRKLTAMLNSIIQL